MAKSPNLKRRLRRQKIRQLAALGRDAESKLSAMSARVNSSNEEFDHLASEQGELRKQAGRLAESNAQMRKDIERLTQEFDRLKSELDGKDTECRIKSARVESLEENLRSLLKSIEDGEATKEHDARALATKMLRKMQPCFRRRMLAKSEEISRLKRAFQLVNSLRDPHAEASVARAMKMRDQIIIGMYSALKWCESRPEFREGQPKSDWDAKIGPLMDKLGRLIKGEAGAPQQQQAEDATEAATG